MYNMCNTNYMDVLLPCLIQYHHCNDFTVTVMQWVEGIFHKTLVIYMWSIHRDIPRQLSFLDSLELNQLVTVVG